MNHKLSLKQHCIETEIKKRYNSFISEYFRTGDREAPELEETIEMFREALETLDFGNLRSRYPELRGNSDADAALFKDEAGRLYININGVDIEP